MSRQRASSLLAVLVIAWSLTITGAWAKPSPTPGNRAPAPGDFKPTTGPATVTLGDNLATLALPKRFIYFGKDDTAKLLKANGAFPDGREIGLIVEEGEKFFIVIEYDEMGYVKDDDAGKIDADSILKSYQEGTEANNEKRREAGRPEIHVTGWAEAPRYEAKSHQVVWALIGKSDKGESVNYFTRMLGRKGVLSLNLVTGKAELENSKKRVASILEGTSFKEGQRYADYQPGTDKDSGMGLTGLILAGGGMAAAAKLGFFAKMGKLLIGLLFAFKKLGVLVVVAIAGLFSRLFGGKKKGDDGALPTEPPTQV